MDTTLFTGTLRSCRSTRVGKRRRECFIWMNRIDRIAVRLRELLPTLLHSYLFISYCFLLYSLRHQNWVCRISTWILRRTS
jgi:hypothetical protein